MPAERTTMREVREVLRLKFVGGGRAAITGTRPSPNTCHPVTGVMPTGPSIASARKRRASGRRPLCELILERRPHTEQGFRACRGILRLERAFGRERLEAAAARAIDIGGLSYGSVRSILDHKLDRQAANKRSADGVPIIHHNIRGSRYYN